VDNEILSDAEIIAGMYEAVGGDLESAVGAKIRVKSIDYTRWGLEAASAETLTWVTGDEGKAKTAQFNPIRTFKPFGMSIVQTAGDPLALFLISISISGQEQLTTRNPVPASNFAPDSFNVPKVRMDTIQTSPGASFELAYAPAAAIPAGPGVKAIVTLSGIALQR
jgi:hypothetical protein